MELNWKKIFKSPKNIFENLVLYVRNNVLTIEIIDPNEFKSWENSANIFCDTVTCNLSLSPHYPKNILNLRIKPTYTVASAPAVAGSVFMRRFRLFLPQCQWPRWAGLRDGIDMQRNIFSPISANSKTLSHLKKGFRWLRKMKNRRIKKPVTLSLFKQDFLRKFCYLFTVLGGGGGRIRDAAPAGRPCYPLSYASLSISLCLFISYYGQPILPVYYTGCLGGIFPSPPPRPFPPPHPNT